MAQGILDELREEVLALRKLVEEKTIKLEQDIDKLKEEFEELEEEGMRLAGVEVGDRVKLRTVLTDIEGVVEGIRPRWFVVRFPPYKGTEKEWRVVELRNLDAIEVLSEEGEENGEGTRKKR